MEYLGDFKAGQTVYVPFATFSGGASITMTGLALANIKIYKLPSTTERASTAGYALLDTDGIDFDGITGVHGFSIDLSNNTVAGFFEAGNDYLIVSTGHVVSGVTSSFSIQFSIENRAGSKLLGSPAGASVSADIAAVAAKTANLPSDPADASVVAGLIAAVDAKIDTIDDFLDTEVAAILTAATTIQAKTDNLPSDPADQSLIIAATDAIAAAVTALNNLSVAQVTTVIEDALTVTARSKPGKEAPDESPTLVYALLMLYKAFANPSNQTSAIWQLFDAAGVVVDQQATLTVDSSHHAKAVVVEGV